MGRKVESPDLGYVCYATSIYGIIQGVLTQNPSTASSRAAPLYNYTMIYTKTFALLQPCEGTLCILNELAGLGETRNFLSLFGRAFGRFVQDFL